MNPTPQTFDVVTVTLNPAIDCTITIPNFTAGAVNRVEAERSNPGGKGVNVAAALADYGHRVAVTGFLGRENATSFEALFAGKQIADHFIRIDGQTRTGIKITDPDLHQTTDINFPGPAPTPADLDALLTQLDSLDAKYFVLAGSLPAGVDPAIYGQFIQRLRTRGRRTVVDTSGEALRHAIEARPYLIKPNLHELETLLGETVTGIPAVIKAARQLNASGIERVVVSMGKAGSCLVTSDEAVIATPPDVEVRSTVGAGDAMVAGLIAGELEDRTLRRCALLATAFSLDVLIRGSSGLGSRAEIESLIERVTATD
ncbi:MAG: 1-phosphofructokinase [Verrucomicrobiota bacterium]